MNRQPRNDRMFNRHVARVYLTQARVFQRRGSPFWRTLLTWARQARVDRGPRPPQGEMFG